MAKARLAEKARGKYSAKNHGLILRRAVYVDLWFLNKFIGRNIDNEEVHVLAVAMGPFYLFIYFFGEPMVWSLDVRNHNRCFRLRYVSYQPEGSVNTLSLRGHLKFTNKLILKVVALPRPK